MNEGQLWMSIGADNTQFQKTAKDTNRKLQEMSQNVKAFSQGITSSFAEAAKSMAGFYAVAKAGTMFQDLIEKNDQFNKSMKEVSTLSDEVANNLDAYKRKILDLTTQIPIGADEAAKALYQINSAGHAGADGMKVLEASAKAAIGGVTDTATAADTITTVLNAYKMSASEAASVSDKLFTAVKLGKTSMGELGASIAQVAPVAASFGVSIDQVLGAIATLTKNGTPTAQAVTQIRAAIVSLSSALGSTYFQTHTLQQAMVDIRTKIPDNNELKEKLGTIEAVNAVLAMTGQNASGAADDLGELAKSAGAAADAYSKMSGGKGNELTKLQNNIMKEMSSLNDTISEVVTNVAHKLNEAFETGAVEEYIDVIKELVVVYGAYKAIAIAVAAVKSANAMITETAETAMYEAQAAELRKVIALKQTQTAVNGETAASEGVEMTARQAEIAALQKEAAEVAKILKEKAAEAAANLVNAKSEQAMAQARLSSAQTGVAMREKDLAAAIASGDALKVETAEIELQKAALEENAAARRLATANKEADIAASRADAAAKAADTAATGMDTAATTGDAVATGFLTKAKIALTVALNKLKVAMATNPLAVATVAITALGYAVYKLAEYFDNVREKEKGVTAGLDKFGRSAEEAKKATEELNSTYAKAKAEIMENISRLRAFKGSKEEEKKLVQELNSKYGEAMGYYSSVSDWYKALTQNSAKYCQQLKNEALIRNLANQAAENEQKIHDIKYNEDGSLKMYKTQGDVIGMYQDINGQVQVQRAKSEQKVAQEDLAKLRKANEAIQKQMQAIFDDNAKISQEIHNGNGGKGGTDAPKGDTKNKAYWEAQKEAVEKEINDLNTEDAEFYKKLDALEKRKKAYEAQIAKYDPSKGESQRNKTKEEQEKQLEARKQLNQELLEMQAKNNDDHIALMEEGHNKRMREISNEYSKEQNEISKTALQWAKQNKDAGLKGDQTNGSVQIAGTVYGGLTKEQQAELEKAIKNAQEKMEKSSEELLQSDIQYMREYLKEYGTFQQQRYAIAQEYDEKIAKLRAGGASEYEIKIAERQKEAALGSSKANELANGIDWSQVMSGVGTMVQSIAQATLSRIDEYRKTDEYKKLSFADKKSIEDLRSQVSDHAGDDIRNPFGDKIWNKISETTKAYENSLLHVKKANEEHEKALKDLEKAEEDYAKALASGEIAKINVAEINRERAKDRVNSTGADVQNAQTESSEAQANLTKTTEGLNQSLVNFSSSIQSLTSGSLSGFANGIVGLVRQFTGAGKEAGKAGGAIGEIGGKAGGLIGAILQLIDILGTEPAKFIEDLLNKIDKVITNVLAQLPEIIMNIIKGVGNIIGGIFEGIGSWFGYKGSNREEIEKANNQLEIAMSVNTQAINRLTAAMEKQNPEEAAKSYEQAVGLLKINEEATMRKMYNNSRKRDGGHSLWSDFADNGGNSTTKKIYSALGKNYTDEGLATMVQTFTASDWNRLLKERPDLMVELGKLIAKSEDSENYNGLFEDILKFASDYSDETFDDLAKKFQEAVTSVSFDTLYDNFVSSLMDMDKSAEDFAHDFEGYLRNAIYQAMAVEKVKPLLERWMKGFEKAMETKEADGKYLSQKEINELMETGGSYTDENGKEQTYMGYKAITEVGFALRDGIEQLGLYNGKNDPNQEALAKGIESITADQADQLIGRMTAIQIAVEADKNTIEGTLTQLIMISSLTTQGNAYLSDILSQHAISNSYLEDIAKYSKAMSLELVGFEERMRRLTTNSERF